MDAGCLALGSGKVLALAGWKRGWSHRRAYFTNYASGCEHHAASPRAAYRGTVNKMQELGRRAGQLGQAVVEAEPAVCLLSFLSRIGPTRIQHLLSQFCPKRAPPIKLQKRHIGASSMLQTYIR